MFGKKENTLTPKVPDSNFFIRAIDADGKSCLISWNHFLFDAGIKPFVKVTASGSGSFNIPRGYGLVQIIAKKISGNPILQAGIAEGESNIFNEEIVDSDPPLTESIRYAPVISNSWDFHYNVVNGIIDLYVQCAIFDNTHLINYTYPDGGQSS